MWQRSAARSLCHPPRSGHEPAASHAIAGFERLLDGWCRRGMRVFPRRASRVTFQGMLDVPKETEEYLFDANSFNADPSSTICIHLSRKAVEVTSRSRQRRHRRHPKPHRMARRQILLPPRISSASMRNARGRASARRRERRLLTNRLSARKQPVSAVGTRVTLPYRAATSCRVDRFGSR